MSNPSNTEAVKTITIELSRSKSFEDICLELFDNLPEIQAPSSSDISSLEQHLSAYLIFHTQLQVELEYQKPFPIKHMGILRLFEQLNEKFDGLVVLHNSHHIS
jgi:hypothetical protein